MSECDFELCIVGAGLIGSAAARHSSLILGDRVCLIGPSEPKMKRTAEGQRDIFGAYYDEGRITRACDSDPVWAKLAQHSIPRYRDIETQSGIPFYTEVGNLMVGEPNESSIKNIIQNAGEQKVPVRTLSAEQLSSLYPYLDFATKDIGVFESRNAGYINPRRLVQAQKLIASKHGCTYIDDVVNNVSRTNLSDGSYIMEVVTGHGRKLKCSKVLLATGSFTTFRNLLPGFEPDQTLCPLTVGLVEVSSQDAKKMRHMPCVIYKGKGKSSYYHGFPRNEDGTVSYYMLPPIKYPDGKLYVKLGHFHATVPHRLYNGEEVKEWYCKGNPKFAEDHAKFIKSIFQGVSMERFKGDYCVVTETKSDRPYIDKVHAQLGVAIGGNGYAAKSSDEIGRIAASLMTDGWSSDIPKDVFRLQIRNVGSVIQAKL